MPNPDRWANRRENSSPDPRVRAKAMHTQEAGLVNNSESMELRGFLRNPEQQGQERSPTGEVSKKASTPNISPLIIL